VPADGRRRCELIRASNRRVAESARSFRFDDRTPVPFLCECDDSHCQEFVLLTLADHDRIRAERRLYALAVGHRLDGSIHHGRIPDRCDLHRLEPAGDEPAR
jgi:hypothetical protein